MSGNIFEIQDLHFNYPDGTAALQGLSVSIERNKKIALLGSNGAGKSTFLLHLIGILKPDKGKVIFNGQELKYDRASLINLRNKVGYVFQDPDTQLFSASVWQEVSFGPMNLGLTNEEVENRVIKALLDTGASHLKDRATHFLSYGQKKLISIADILAMNPDMIIFDEPTASLDPKYTHRILDLLNDINERGISIIMATHDVDKAYQWADIIFVMKDGRIAKVGPPEEIFNDEHLIENTSLEKPLLLKIFQELQLGGYISQNITAPRNVNQLIKILHQNAVNQ
ncbi:cobalt/nickel transport system ATP-binding protein [Desulforamulus putei DSM 12395]|uniref:ABC transporter ATP-binding protein n=1 Tax=Desulforamulus putei DSM 12395 TaxID=1121429 RepID=A0A1M4T774_9FIRM|nr:ATP-binding cassette domain-containing protein [Desulforamulus putei]SHE40329.1 cobalt/nickel transport system ATP-binding protein [Desulforamulus putei DSM 12395]